MLLLYSRQNIREKNDKVRMRVCARDWKKARSTERKRKKERNRALSGKKRENVDVRKGKYVKERAKGHMFAYIYTYNIYKLNYINIYK